MKARLAAAALITIATIAPAPVSAEGRAADPVPQFLDEAGSLEADLKLTASSRGWTLDEARANHDSAEEVGRIATLVAKLEPDAFVGSALSEDPRGPATLYVSGAASARVYDLVASAKLPVVLVDRQPWSAEQLAAQRTAAYRSLVEAGLADVVIQTDIANRGAMSVTVGSVSISAKAQIEPVVLSVLPSAARASATVIVHDGPVTSPEAAFGGMQFRQSGTFLCTSGFSVVREYLFTVTHGVATAQHCTGVNEVQHPGHGVHAATYVTGVVGEYGDFRWHTTAESEPDDFYSDSAVVRDVSSVEAASAFSINEVICAYGRASNDRDCSLEVSDPEATCGTKGRQVIMNGDTQTGGDSGGPWFYANRAYGFHMGNCGVNAWDAFSKADYIDQALGGVRVKTE
jgi:hypothetical protein